MLKKRESHDQPEFKAMADMKVEAVVEHAISPRISWPISTMIPPSIFSSGVTVGSSAVKSDKAGPGYQEDSLIPWLMNIKHLLVGALRDIDQQFHDGDLNGSVTHLGRISSHTPWQVLHTQTKQPRYAMRASSPRPKMQVGSGWNKQGIPSGSFT